MDNLIPPLGYRSRYHAQVSVVRKLGAHNMPEDERVTSPAAFLGLVISVIAIRKHRRLVLVIANSIFRSTSIALRKHALKTMCSKNCAHNIALKTVRSQHATHRCGCGDRPHFTLEDKRFEMRTITLLSFGWR